MSKSLIILEDYNTIYQKTINLNSQDLNQIDIIIEKLRKHIKSLNKKLYNKRESLLIAIRFVECFKIFKWIKVCLAYGSYNSAFRDLRFLIDSIIQAYYIDLNHFNASLKSKLEVLKGLSEYAKFYGSELINKITNLPNKQKLRDLFGELSNYVHASYEESKPFIDATSKKDVIDSLKYNRYDETLLKKCIDKCIEVSDKIIEIDEDFEKKYLKIIS